MVAVIGETKIDVLTSTVVPFDAGVLVVTMGFVETVVVEFDTSVSLVTVPTPEVLGTFGVDSFLSSLREPSPSGTMSVSGCCVMSTVGVDGKDVDCVVAV